MTLLQKTIKREQTGRVPIWFMRQAGRYLPEYREMKKGRDFMQMVMDPKIASEITLQPIKRYDIDAAIIFSDIMVLLHALDMGVSFATGAPEISRVVTNEKDIDTLIGEYNPDVMKQKLDFYEEAIRLTRSGLPQDKSLLGFAAAPFTLASYMIEGKTSKTHAKVRGMMYREKETFSKLMDFICESTLDYLDLQIAAGVDTIQLFDSWGDAMSTEDYQTYALPFVKKISQEISKKVPVIFFCRGASIHREALLDMYDAGVSVLSLDWRMPIDYFGERTVQGNLDPAVLFSDPETVQKKTTDILLARGNKPGFIFNLGHGIYPETPLENVQSMVDTVKNFKPTYPAGS